MTTCNIYNEDANSFLDQIPANTIDLVFTSPNPPFYALKNNILDKRYVGSEPTTTHYNKHLCSILGKVKRVLKDSGSLWLHMSDFHHGKGTLLMIPEVVASRLIYQWGFILQTKGIWVRENFTPPASTKRFKTNYDPVFVFTKKIEPEFYFNEDAINKNAIGTSVWNFPTQNAEEFPKSMVEFAIKSSCPEGGVVLDCFSGDGTTGEVALINNRHFVGIEINEQRYGKSVRKLEEIKNTR
jgi:DNA modification methylase